MFTEPSSSPSQTSVMQFPSEPLEHPEMRRTPPPLPPRRGNSSAAAPPPPPRVDSHRPPPVPPRKDSIPSTLARSHSMSHPCSPGLAAQNFFPEGSSTLPRAGLERQSSERNLVMGAPPVVDCNSNEDYGDRPVLPPRTYRAHLSHLRNQTS